MTRASGIEGLDEELERTRAYWNAPGISCVVLKDSETTYSGAKGLRDIKNELPMTTKTLQPIGSTSKAFTSTAVAMLVDDGKLQWDIPLHKQFPKFELKDPIASSMTTLIDMLSHRTGLPRHDFVWASDVFRYSEIFERLPHLDFSKEFRTTFQYCNLMYIAAAALVEAISGMDYRVFVKKRIFTPLKMNAVMTLKAMIDYADHAKGYSEIAGVRTEVEYDSLAESQYTAATGAGSINASIEDMGNWLGFHLNGGKAGNKQLLSSANLKRTHQSVIIGGYDTLNQWLPDQKWVKQPAYGLGWQTDVYRGHSRVRHGGNTDGSSTEVCFLPDEGIGVGCIVNEYGTPLTNAVVNIIIDRLFGLELVDWSSLLKPSFDAMNKVVRESASHEETLKVPDTSPSHRLEEYLGKYLHPGYGIFGVLLEDQELKLKYGTLNLPLSHHHYDTFQLTYERYDFRELLTFYSDSNGDIDSFTIRIEAALPPIRFIRQADEHLSDPNFLRKLVGKYDFFGRVIELTLRNDNVLLFNMPGRNPEELVPVRGMRFRQKDSSSMTITFKSDENENITGFVVSQMGAVIPGTRVTS